MSESILGNYRDIKVIGFDADDTLWVNETYFRDAEDEFCKMLRTYETENSIRQTLFKFEMQNLDLYGYGIKGFVLSMIECAHHVSAQKLPSSIYYDIINLGKSILNKPVELIDGVKDTLPHLSAKYKIFLITKGDLLDQERKLEKSGLSSFFHHVEIVSNKYPSNYKNLLENLDIEAKDFLMIGNSLKSDILPVIELGGRAIHIPFHVTWEHEKVDTKLNQDFATIDKFSDLIGIL